MHGRRSCHPNLILIDPELERTLKAIRASRRTSNTLAPSPPMALNNQDNQEPRPLMEYFTPAAYTSPSCIRLPNIEAAQYEIKSSTIQMLPTFYGLSNEDPYKHINEFKDISSTVKIQNLNDDALKLLLFPFSLKDKAKHWFNTLAADSITTWAQMQQAFLKKYFPIGKTNQIRRAINSFSQLDGEQFHETWERFNDLLRTCPHHEIRTWNLVNSFYHGLLDHHRQMVDAACGGTFLLKSEDEAWELFKILSENSQQHAYTERSGRTISLGSQQRGVYEVGHNSELSNQVATLTQKVDQLLTLGHIPSPLSQPPVVQEACALCLNPTHFVSECPMAF